MGERSIGGSSSSSLPSLVPASNQRVDLRGPGDHKGLDVQWAGPAQGPRVLQQPATDPQGGGKKRQKVQIDPQVGGKRQKAQRDAAAGQDPQQPSFSGQGDRKVEAPPGDGPSSSASSSSSSSSSSSAYKRSKRDVEQNPLALKSVPLDELSRRERFEICTLALSGSRFDELSPHEQFKICRHVLSVWKLCEQVLIGCIFAKFDQLLPNDRWELLADLRRGGGDHYQEGHKELDMTLGDLTIDSHDGFAWIVTSPSALPGQRCLLQKDGLHYYRLPDDQLWKLVNLCSGSARPEDKQALVQADPDDGIIAPEWVKDHPLVGGWLKDLLLQRPYSLKKVRDLLADEITGCYRHYWRGQDEYAHDMVKATTEYLVRFRPEYMVELTDAEKTPVVCLAAIAGGKSRFLDTIPLKRWHSPEFCEQAYRTGVPNVDAYIYYYGGENTWRNVLDACREDYRLPAVVPNDAEQLPGGDKRTADAAADGKAPVQGIRRLPEEFVSRITALTGDPLSDVYVNMDVIQGPGRRRERARATAREAATRLEMVRSGQRLDMFPRDKQTYRMVMTALDFDGEALSTAAPKFQADPAICLKAATNFRGAMKHVKAEKLSPENYLKVCLTAASDRKSLEGQKSALEGVEADRIGSKNYLKVCLAALNSVPVEFFVEQEGRYLRWDKLDPADKLELNIALGKKGISVEIEEIERSSRCIQTLPRRIMLEHRLRLGR